MPHIPKNGHQAIARFEDMAKGLMAHGGQEQALTVLSCAPIAVVQRAAHREAAKRIMRMSLCDR